MEMVIPTDNNETPGLEDPQQNKRRRKKSIVWEYFTVQTVGAGCSRAYCKQCKKSFAYITGTKLAGTSHLKRHISLGICPVSRLNQENNNLLPFTPDSNISAEFSRKRYRATPGSAASSVPFDQDRCGYEIAKMIILHDYPLDIVEQPGFIDFVRTLQPHFNMLSVKSIQDECVGVYLREKHGLLNLFGGIPGRVSLTLDMWSSDLSVGYVVLTGHFIDGNWKLNRRILNVIMVLSPDSDVAFNHAVAACLTDWSLDNKLFCLTLDRSFANTNVRENLRGFISFKNPIIINGQLMIGNCYARTLSRIVQDALGLMMGSIGKVRESIKYVKTSGAHEERFLVLKQQLQVSSTKCLIIDDKTKWNTTYHMLVAAAEHKEVFSCLDTSDPNYKETPSMEEWKQVEILCAYLKLLYDAANILSSVSYPTANLFFHEVWKIQLELTHAAMSDDPFISNLIRPLQEKFENYWRESNMVLAIAVVMDPRFKMKLVEFSFSRIYGDDAETWIKIVDEGLHELFLEYFVHFLPPPTYVDAGNNELLPKTEEESQDDGLSDFDVYISEMTSSEDMKSELDQYLEESLLPRVQDFDVLGWWKLNRIKYPSLSKMAADVLSIPVSTVPPDSIFDLVSKKMDTYRSSMKPMTLEALVCAKDWLQYGSSDMFNSIVKMEF